MSHFICSCLLILSFFLHANEAEETAHLIVVHESTYVKHPDISEETWHSLIPYFLPEQNPVKKELDTIFSQQRVLASKTAMRNAGFNILKHPQRDMIIARHPQLKGYLIKAYLDNKRVDESYWWKRRIDGVRQIQESIDSHQFNSMMKTPKKWIYPLPLEPWTEHSHRHFVLIVEDMNIVSRKKNLICFKRDMTHALLDALYLILTENLLIDSFFAPNIPFSHDGKIAILDTEHYNRTEQPLKLWKLARYLSAEMRAHWDQLIHAHDE